MGKLILVTVPIGNPQDITLRALEYLKQAKVLLAEDTRSTLALLKHYQIPTDEMKIVSFHDQSGEQGLAKVTKFFHSGDVYYVSEAGSPCISDPGLSLTRYCVEQDIEIDSASGISSVIMALELSGLPSLPFHFHGFLARGKKELENFANSVIHDYGTHIIFESPYRMEESLTILTSQLSEYQFCLCRELSKTYESVYRFQGSEFLNIKEKIIFKGEMVLLVYNGKRGAWSVNKIKSLAQKVVEKNGKKKALTQLLSYILPDQDISLE
jgi:16S rRNA (cytidine1402-2'-O)-methyltransferase